MKPPSVKSVRCAIYTRTADSQITTSSGRWARDIAYAANAVANDDGQPIQPGKYQTVDAAEG